MWYGHGWWMGFWWIVGVGVIALVVWLVTRGNQRPTSPSAEDVLRQRYANGEIDEEEYRKRLAMLRQRRP